MTMNKNNTYFITNEKSPNVVIVRRQFARLFWWLKNRNSKCMEAFYVNDDKGKLYCMQTIQGFTEKPALYWIVLNEIK